MIFDIAAGRLTVGDFPGGGSTRSTIQDTRENILALTPSELTVAHATDYDQLYVYIDQWYEVVKR